VWCPFVHLTSLPSARCFNALESDKNHVWWPYSSVQISSVATYCLYCFPVGCLGKGACAGRSEVQPNQCDSAQPVINLLQLCSLPYPRGCRRRCLHRSWYQLRAPGELQTLHSLVSQQGFFLSQRSSNDGRTLSVCNEICQPWTSSYSHVPNI